MCIICYYPPTVSPEDDDNLKHLREGASANPHGYGWAVIANDGSEILMGHSMDRYQAIEEFLTVRRVHTANAAMFHARITTAGTTTLDNCHPFWVGGKRLTAVAHNGWLPCDPEIGDRRSDTRIFAEDIAAKRFPALDSNKTRRRLETWMGRHSKMVFLTVDPGLKCQAYIFNESAGVWDGAVWYSNDSYRPFWASTKRSGSMAGAGWVSSATQTGSGWDEEYERWWDEQQAEKVSARASAERSVSLVFLHNDCGQDENHCLCVGGSRVFTCVDLLTSDKPEHYLCSCGLFGRIDEETMLCRSCGECWSCGYQRESCSCPDRPVWEAASVGSRDWRQDALDEVKAALALPAAPEVK